MKSKIYQFEVGETVIWDGEDAEIIKVKGSELLIRFEDGSEKKINEEELHF